MSRIRAVGLGIHPHHIPPHPTTSHLIRRPRRKTGLKASLPYLYKRGWDPGTSCTLLDEGQPFWDTCVLGTRLAWLLGAPTVHHDLSQRNMCCLHIAQGSRPCRPLICPCLVRQAPAPTARVGVWYFDHCKNRATQGKTSIGGDIG